MALAEALAAGGGPNLIELDLRGNQCSAETEALLVRKGRGAHLEGCLALEEPCTPLPGLVGLRGG